MKYNFLCLLTILILSSCSIKKQAIADKDQEINSYPQLKINALNLSEDLSRLASQNDEILILGYKNQDTLSDVFIQEYLIFEEEQKSHTIPLDSRLFAEGELILFVLEIDTELRPQEIEKMVRMNAAEIENTFSKNDRVTLKSLLGDDDLLGIARINQESLKFSHTYNIIGTHKLDRYEYELHFMNLNITK